MLQSYRKDWIKDLQCRQINKSFVSRSIVELRNRSDSQSNNGSKLALTSPICIWLLFLRITSLFFCSLIQYVLLAAENKKIKSSFLFGILLRTESEKSGTKVNLVAKGWNQNQATRVLI